MNAARRAGASVVGALFVACALAPSCKPKLDPNGHHAGTCVVVARPAAGRGDPGTEPCGDAFDVFDDGDGKKIELGDCTVHLSPARDAEGGTFALRSIAPCRVKAGAARMLEGKLYAVSGTWNFTFEGETDDRKSKLSWAFSGAAPAR